MKLAVPPQVSNAILNFAVTVTLILVERITSLEGDTNCIVRVSVPGAVGVRVMVFVPLSQPFHLYDVIVLAPWTHLSEQLYGKLLRLIFISFVVLAL